MRARIHTRVLARLPHARPRRADVSGRAFLTARVDATDNSRADLHAIYIGARLRGARTLARVA